MPNCGRPWIAPTSTTPSEKPSSSGWSTCSSTVMRPTPTTAPDTDRSPPTSTIAVSVTVIDR